MSWAFREQEKLWCWDAHRTAPAGWAGVRNPQGPVHREVTAVDSTDKEGDRQTRDGGAKGRDGRRRREWEVRRWRHGRTGCEGEGLLGLGWGYFSAFPFQLKKIFTLFIQREQELTGEKRLLGTGREMWCTSEIWKRRPILSKPEIQMQPDRREKQVDKCIASCTLNAVISK